MFLYLQGLSITFALRKAFFLVFLGSRQNSAENHVWGGGTFLTGRKCSVWISARIMGPIFKKWDAKKANNNDKSDFFI